MILFSNGWGGAVVGVAKDKTVGEAILEGRQRFVNEDCPVNFSATFWAKLSISEDLSKFGCVSAPFPDWRWDVDGLGSET